MTINYNLIFKDGLTDAAIDEAIEFTRIKIYRDIDDIVKRHKWGYYEGHYNSRLNLDLEWKYFWNMVSCNTDWFTKYNPKRNL